MATTNQKTAVIIPAYNEGESIAHLLTDLTRTIPPHWDIIVINDGSHDDTEFIARQYASKTITLPINLGIGGCMQTGLLFAYRKGYDHVVQFDGDGQHVATEIKTLLWAMQETKADVMVGSRFIQNFSGQFRSTFVRRLGIRVIRLTLYLLTGQRIKDPTSGFRVFNAEAIKLFAEHYPVHYPEPESLILLHKHNLKVHEISTLMNPRQGGKSSLSKKAGFYMFNVLMGMIFSAMRPQMKHHGD